MLVSLTAAELGAIAACPAVAAIIAILAIAVKIVKAYKGIQETVLEKADRQTVNELIEELRAEKKENRRLKRLLVETIETNTKVSYEGSHDDEGNKKV